MDEREQPRAVVPLWTDAEAQGLRQDAARNAAKVLDAATTLVERCGADAVTMDAVAEAAGVGKGTVFRRFGSRAGLMAALMNHTEARFQAAFMTGPPPLGPGAPPRARLLAYGAARMDLVLQHSDLMTALGPSRHPALVPAFEVSCTHVRMLLSEAGAGGDLELLAAHLVHALEPAWVRVQLEHHCYPVSRILSSWEDLVTAVLDRAVAEAAGDR